MFRIRYSIYIAYHPVYYVPRRYGGGGGGGGGGESWSAPGNIPLPPIFHAVHERSSDKLKEALKTGKVNEKWQSNGITALHLACQLPNSNDIVTFLLENGADPKLTNDHLETPLHLIGDEENSDVCDQKIKMLLKAGVDVDAQNSLGRSALSRAVFMNNLQTATSLLTAGAKVDLEDHEGKTPLYLAIEKKRDPAFVDLLLDFKADPNKATKTDRSPLWAAVDDKNFALVKVLLSAGGVADRTDRYGLPMVISALRTSTPEIAEELITGGAAVSVKHNNETPLYLSAKLGSAKLVKAVLTAYPPSKSKEMLLDVMNSRGALPKDAKEAADLLDAKKAQLLQGVSRSIEIFVHYAKSVKQLASTTPDELLRSPVAISTILFALNRDDDASYVVVLLHLYEALELLCKQEAGKKVVEETFIAVAQRHSISANAPPKLKAAAQSLLKLVGKK